MSTHTHPNPASAERNIYSDQILTQKIGDEKEALELVKLKLTASKLYNEQLVTLFKQISLIKRNHHQQLRKLYSENENINNIVFNTLAKQTGHDIGALTEVFSEGGLLGANFTTQVYQSLLEEIRTEMNHTAKFEKVLNEKFITSLDNYDSNNLQIRETWNLLDHLLKNNGSSALWETNGPLLYQMFESSDAERLSFLKQTLLDFEVLVGQYQVALTNKNQSTYNKIDKFSVEDELKSFAAFASYTSFKSIVKGSASTKSAPAQNTANHKRAASIATSSADLRHTSSSTVLKHDLMHSNFTNSTAKGKLTNNALMNAGKKEKKKLRSKFGTLFGRKNKNKDLPNASREDLSERESTHSAQQRLSRRPSNIAQVASASNVAQVASVSNVAQVASVSNVAQSSASFSGAQTSASVSNAYVSAPVSSSPRYGDSEYNSNSNKALPRAPEPVYAVAEDTPSSSYAATGSYDPPSVSHMDGGAAYSESSDAVSKQAESVVAPAHPSSSEHMIPEAPKPRKSNKRVQSQLFSDLNISARESVYLQEKTLEPQVTGTADESVVPNFVHPNLDDSPVSGDLNPDVTLVAPGDRVDLSSAVVNSSVAEVVNYIRVPTDLVGEDGEQVYKEKIDVVGEIALSLPPALSTADLSNQGLSLSLDNDAALAIDNIIYNHELLNPIDGSETIYDVFDPNKLVGKSVGLFKYQINESDCDKGIYTPPVTMHSIWNHEDTKSSMVLSVKNASSSPLTFQTCTISIQVLDCQVTQVLSKPNGVFNKKKQKIIWRFNDSSSQLQFDPLEEKKFIVRFMTDKKGREGKSNIEFSMLGYNGARNANGLLAVNVLDSAGEKLKTNTVNSLVSGKYYTV